MGEAAAHYRLVLEIDAEHAEAHNNLGKVWRAQGNLELAIRNFREAISADPKHWIAQLNLVRALQSAGKIGEARTA
ncbi:MAG: tetratricopeptide repeat protein [Acidobacteria bacterium]|nr:tetratricopeptide repeat protein [Acidobacteriota bacterium]